MLYSNEIELYQKLHRKIERYLFYFCKPEDDIKRELRKKLKRDLYFVYITVGKTQKLAFKDRDTHKCYKVDKDYTKTWIEWKQYTFIRDCRLMDL